MFTPILSAALLALAPAAVQQVDDTGNLFPPAVGTTSSGGVLNNVGCGSGSTTTLFAANNGQAGNMFDIAVTSAVDITIPCIDINTSLTTTATVEVWAIPGTCVGNDTGDMCALGWVLIGGGTVTGLGQNVPTNVPLSGAPTYVFTAGSTYGLYVTLIGSTSIRYTNGVAPNGGPYFGTHCDITTYYGKPNYTPPCTLSGSSFFVREWNGVLYTELVGAPGLFCLTSTGTCPGPMTLDVVNATPSSNVAIVHGLAGSFTKPSGTCAGIVLDILNPALGALIGTDAAGAASLPLNAPAAACGQTVQGVDVATCTASNSIVL